MPMPEPGTSLETMLQRSQGDVISPYDDVALVLHHQFGVFHDCYSTGGGGLP